MVVLSLQKYVPNAAKFVRINNLSDEYDYSKYYKKVIKDYVYYPQRRVIG